MKGIFLFGFILCIYVPINMKEGSILVSVDVGTILGSFDSEYSTALFEEFIVGCCGIFHMVSASALKSV